MRLVRSAAQDRVPGLAAEMASSGCWRSWRCSSPSGWALGYLERILGVEQVADLEGVVVGTLAVVLGSETSFDTLAPRQGRGGRGALGRRPRALSTMGRQTERRSGLNHG